MENSPLEVGARFGQWELLALPVKSSKRKCLCRCMCGTEALVRDHYLRTGTSTRCKNCQAHVGETFGSWTIISKAPMNKKVSRVIAKCACGTEKLLQLGALRNGSTRSCGCKSGELLRETFKNGPSTTNLFRSPERYCWAGMRNRCYSPTNASFHNYGGRGITVCDRWKNSFENFFVDMGPRPVGTSIDRIDVNGNYEPGNCRWATHKEQMANVRSCKPKAVVKVRTRRIKLSLQDMRDIQQQARQGVLSRELQSRYNISPATVSSLKTGNYPRLKLLDNPQSSAA